MRLISDVKLMKKVLLEFEVRARPRPERARPSLATATQALRVSPAQVDTQKLPLGKLSKQQLTAA